MYRSCGDCTNNEAKSPRKVIVENVRAYGLTSDLIGINSNFGDEATVSGSCGQTNKVCQEYAGVNKGNGKSSKVDTKASCKGAQGQLDTLPACGAGEEVPEPEVPSETPITTTAPAPSTLVTISKTAEESAPTEGSSGSVARWGRCGGKGYTGPTTCAEGECKVQNEWYSQCL